MSTVLLCHHFPTDTAALPYSYVSKCAMWQRFLFLGEPNEANELLTWLLYQMKEDTIENINRDLLTLLIEKEDFLAVVFCKQKHITS